MKHKQELQNNLDLRQAEILALNRDEDIWSIETRLGAVFKCKTVIVATGTFLGGNVYVGDVSYESGPDGLFPAAF